MTITLLLRGSKPTKQPIKIRYSHNGKTAYIDTGISVNPKNFQNVHGKWIKNAEPNAVVNNLTLTTKFNAVSEYCAKHLNEKEVYPEATEMRGFFNKVKAKSEKPTLAQLEKEYLAYAMHRPTKPIGIERAQHYKVMFKRLAEFSPNFDADTVTEMFFGAFKEFLRASHANEHNTVDTKITMLKSFLYWLIEDKRTTLDRSVVASVKTKWKQRDIIFLTTAEQKKLFELNLQYDPHLDKVRDVFLFQCKTCLRYSDTDETNWSISDDRRYIVVMPSKTEHSSGASVKIPVDSDLRFLIDKYHDAGQPFPRLNNADYNEKIKTVGHLAGITTEITLAMGRKHFGKGAKLPKYKLLSSHVARATGICEMLNRSVPETVVCKVAGITPNTLKHYAFITDNTVEREFDRIEKERGSLRVTHKSEVA